MTWTVVIAMALVAGLACFAVSQGFDGAIISTAFTVIGALAGVKIGMTVQARRHKKEDDNGPGVSGT